MALDSISDGFGTTAPVDLSGSPGAQMVRYIRSQKGGLARVLSISTVSSRWVSNSPNTGAHAVYVLRGSANLGIGGGLNSTFTVPFIPPNNGVNMPGLPLQQQIFSAGLELLWQSIMPVDQCDPTRVNFDPWELVARDGQVLGVFMSQWMDLSFTPPNMSFVNIAQGLSVSGEFASLDTTNSVLGGVSRSLPRYQARV